MLRHFIEFLKRLCGAKPAPKPERKLLPSNVSEPLPYKVEPRPRSPKLTTHKAAEILGISYDNLRTRRQRGTGPKFERQGRNIYYYLCDLLNWKAAREELKSCGQ